MKEFRPSLPSGIQLGIGAVFMVAMAFGAAAFTSHASIQRLLVMVIATAFAAALMTDWRYSAGVAVIGYLLYLGFLVNQYGTLTWDGTATIWQVTLFAAGFVLGRGQRWMRAAVAEPAEASAEPQITGASRRR